MGRVRKEPFEVIEVREETATVKTFRLSPKNKEVLPIGHKAGQCVLLEFEMNGEMEFRNYSLVNPETRPDPLELTVKKENLCSVWLHENLKVGDELLITAPAGRFKLKEDERPVALLAGGVGITPLMSFARFLSDSQDARKVRLFNCIRTRQDVIFRDELVKLPQQNPNFALYTLYSEETSAAGRNEGVGFLSVDLIESVLGMDFRNWSFYICGPAVMMDAIIPALLEAGVPEEFVYKEAF